MVENFEEKKSEVVDQISAIFADMSIDQIDELYKAIRSEATEAKKKIRAEIRAAEKAKALEEREKKSEENSSLLDNVAEGTEVTILVGSGKNTEEVTGEFIKKTEKRFIVLVDGQKKSVMFHRLVSVNDAVEEVSEEDFLDTDIDAVSEDEIAL